MKTFHRYIFKQILGTALLSIGFFILVLVLGNALRDMSEKIAGAQLPVGTVLYMIGLIIPGVLPYALPMGLLTAILLVFGRMSSQHEITAARAAGFSLWSIAFPVFILGALGIGVSLFINLYYAPLADTKYRYCILNIIRENPLRFLSEKHFIHEFPGYVIYITEKQDKAMKELWLWELDSNKRVSAFIKAKKGSVHYDEAKNVIRMSVQDGIAERRPSEAAESFKESQVPTLLFKEIVLDLPLDKILGAYQYNRKLAFHTLPELLALKKPYLAAHIPGSKERYAYNIKIQLQIQQKFAMAFSVYALISLAIPLGIKVSRQETMVNMVLALLLALAYYTCLVLLSWTEKYPHWRPDLLVWTPNIVFQSLGLYLLWRGQKL